MHTILVANSLVTNSCKIFQVVSRVKKVTVGFVKIEKGLYECFFGFFI